MLSDEEQKAIERLEDLLKQRNENKIQINTYDLFGTIEIVLNLIEKQAKEIEHQKEKRENQKQELAILNEKQKEFNKLVNTVNSYKGQFKRQRKEIEELKKNNGYHLGFIDGRIAKRYEMEDKIKAKIEEEDKLFFKTKDVRHANRYKAYKELLEKE